MAFFRTWVSIPRLSSADFYCFGRGTEGKGTRSIWAALQLAQGAPAAMPEFKGNVSVVYTGKQWDHKLAAAAKKMKWVNKKMFYRYKDGVEKESPRAEELRAGYIKQQGLTEEDVKLTAGASDGTYHYLGSAKIYSRIGKAFAESMLSMEKK